MKRLAVVAALALSACTATPKTWTPTQYSAPPGVTHAIWEACWKQEDAKAQKLGGSSYNRLTLRQKQCLVMRLTRECVEHAIRLVKEHAPLLGAKCDLFAFQDFMTEAEYEQCGDNEGGSNQVIDLYIYVRDSGREDESGGVRNRDVCPAY